MSQIQPSFRRFLPVGPILARRPKLKGTAVNRIPRVPTMRPYTMLRPYKGPPRHPQRPTLGFLASPIQNKSRTSTTVAMGDVSKEKVHLTGPEELLLATLFMRAQDCQLSQPVLGDHYAQQIINRCDIDPEKSHYRREERWVRAVACRGKELDDWCQDFLDTHGDNPVTVIHLGCGLDSRYWRVRKGKNVRWIDIDQPSVVDVRQRLVPQPDGDYTLRTLQITKPGWTCDIPSERPTLVIGEGLFMYLEPEEGRAIFREIASTFPEGEIHFDTLCWLTKFVQSWVPIIRSSGSVIKWGTDDPRGEVEACHPKLKLVDQKLWAEYNGTNPPIYGEFLTRIATWIPRYKWDVCLSRFKY